MTEIVVYSDKSCGACDVVVPFIKDLVRGKRNVTVKVVDIDKCGDKCDWVGYVPLVTVDGREIDDLNNLERMLK